MDRIKPIRLTMKATGEVYELDFSRDSVRFAESRGFDPSDVQKYLGTKVDELWYYAFRMHHKSLSMQQTSKIKSDMGGITPEILERLILLYAQAVQSNNIQDEEDFAKNSVATVEM